MYVYVYRGVSFVDRNTFYVDNRRAPRTSFATLRPSFFFEFMDFRCRLKGTSERGLGDYFFFKEKERKKEPSCGKIKIISLTLLF